MKKGGNGKKIVQFKLFKFKQDEIDIRNDEFGDEKEMILREDAQYDVHTHTHTHTHTKECIHKTN